MLRFPSRRRAIAAAVVVGAVALPLMGSSPAPAADLAPVNASLSRVLADAPPTTLSVIAHGDSSPAVAAAARRVGLDVADTYQSIPAAHLVGPAALVQKLRRDPAIEFVEHDDALQLHDATGVWATRTRDVQEAVNGGPYDASAAPGIQPATGKGVGIAIVDSGVDTAHPDLASTPARPAKSWQIVCPATYNGVGFVDPETGQCFRKQIVDVTPVGSDHLGGHGTHVAGIAAGSGAASTGKTGIAGPVIPGHFAGAAPEAALYGFNVGEGIYVTKVVEAFDFIYANRNNTAVFPVPVRVVNNSWGDVGNPYDPDEATSQLVRLLVADGVTFTFSAGNSGGDGSEDMTSRYCKDPTPGVICVANYNDARVGHRSATLDTGSSRGVDGQPTNSPDLSAPGVMVVSTCRPTSGPLCTSGADTPVAWGGFIMPSSAWAPNYAAATGTSMSAPAVAGAVALLQQAKPTLTPAQIEDVLLDTAHKFPGDDTAAGPYVADPQNVGGTISFDKGAGLMDVRAAFDALAIPKAGTAGPTVITDGDGGDHPNGSADIESVSVVPLGDRVRFDVTVRNAADLPPGLNPSVRVFQTTGNTPRFTTATITATGANVVAAEGTDTNPTTIPAVAASRSGNTVSITILYSALQAGPAGTAVFDVSVATYIGTYADVAPSPAMPTAGADFVARPLRAASYTVG